MAKDNSNTSGGRASKDANSRGGGVSGGSKGNRNNDSGRDGKNNSRTTNKATKNANSRGSGRDGGQKPSERPASVSDKSFFDHVKDVATEQFSTPSYKSSGVLQQVPVVGSFVTLGDALGRYAASRGISVNPTDPTRDARNGNYNRTASNLQPQPPAQPGPSLPDGVGGPQAPNPDYLQSAGRPPLEAAFDMALRSGRSRVRIPLLGAVRSAKGAGVSIR